MPLLTLVIERSRATVPEGSLARRPAFHQSCCVSPVRLSREAEAEAEAEARPALRSQPAAVAVAVAER